MHNIHFLQILAVGVGGFFGAISRSIVSNQMDHWLGKDFVYGTLTVNALGSFVLGLLVMLMIEKFHLTIEWKGFFIVGFLGAFTTFSTFAFETVMYLQQGAIEKAVINIASNVFITILMVWIGLYIGRYYFVSHG